MRIAILFICTGRYNQFFPDFYQSSQTYLLRNAKKEYFVWTDDDGLAEGCNNVHVIHKKCEGFPLDSLFRFEMFMQVEEQLKQFDYIYFVNSNALFLKPVNEEILPDDSGLAMGIHPGKRVEQHPMFYPYERNKKSLAYIAPYGKDYHYFMGGLNGGRTREYLEMIRELANNIRVDYNNGIIAIYHDESHINAYMRKHSCKILPTYLTMAEEIATPEAKMIFREKTHIDPYFNKNRSFSIRARVSKAFKTLYSIIRWYLKF